MSDPRDDPQVRAAWDEWNRNTPESFWDVAMWDNKGGALFGSLDVANRYEIWAHAFLAGRADTAAQAWDEGYRASAGDHWWSFEQGDECEEPHRPNPYRARAAQYREKGTPDVDRT